MAEETDALRSVSTESVKTHFLDHQGIIKKRKATQIDIKNDSSYDLVIVVEIDPDATKLTDGTKITKDTVLPPTLIQSISANNETKLDVHSKLSFITVLRKIPKETGFYVVRSKRSIERSSKWTATNKMIEAATLHVEEAYLNQFTGGEYVDKPSPVTNVQSPLLDSSSAKVSTKVSAKETQHEAQ
jgi:hypothetical protein